MEAQNKDTDKMVQHHDEDMYARKAFEITSKEAEDTMIVTFLGKVSTPGPTCPPFLRLSLNWISFTGYCHFRGMALFGVFP